MASVARVFPLRAVTTSGIAALLAATCSVVAAAAPAQASPAGDGLVISEFYGGGGNSGATFKNDFVELYNPTGAPISVDGYSVQYRSATGTGAGAVTPLSGSVPAHGHYLVQEAVGSGGSQDLPTPDAVGTIALAAGGGQVWLASTTAALTPPTGNVTGAPYVDFLGAATNAVSFEGAHVSAAPSNTTSIARTDDGHDTDVNAADFSAGAPTPASSGSGSNGDGGDGSDPGQPPAATVSIADIQGDGASSPLAGQTVSTTGVITAKYPTGGFNGMYIETPGADTPGRSDGIFVYGSSSGATDSALQVGDSVQVTGTVSEFNGLTEITPATGGVTELATSLGSVQPRAIAYPTTEAGREAREGELLAPTDEFTVSNAYSANQYAEIGLATGDHPLEQPTERVAGTDTAGVQRILADNAARGVVLDDASTANFLTPSNTEMPWLTPANPVRVGDTATLHQPVILDYRNGLWKFEPTHTVTDDGHDVVGFSDTRADNLAPAQVGGNLHLATFNVENFFDTTGQAYVADLGGRCSYYTDRTGTPVQVNTCTGPNGEAGPRGAATDASFARQQAKTVTAINGLGADVVSLEELENSVKFGLDRDETIAKLVAALNATAGAGTWAYVPSPASASEPTNVAQQDVIRTGFIYKPAKATPVGTSRILFGSAPFEIAREPLAQAFKAAGASDADAFVVVANHWKSKGDDAGNPATGDDAVSVEGGQVGAYNGTRVREADAVLDWIPALQSDFGVQPVFLLGDFNSYSHEDPVLELQNGGFALVASDDPADNSYSYGGLSGSLDHVFANPAALALKTGADVWEVNADESVAFNYSRYNYHPTILFDASTPFATSDHNPEIVGIAAPTTPAVPAWNAADVYTAGDTVNYAGSTWSALWWTQNQRPGDPYGPWQQIATAPDGTALWTATRVFDSGDVVEYDGARYRARWYTRNQAPGDPYGPWQAL